MRKQCLYATSFEFVPQTRISQGYSLICARMDVATYSRNKYLYGIKLLPGFRVHEAAVGLATK